MNKELGPQIKEDNETVKELTDDMLSVVCNLAGVCKDIIRAREENENEYMLFLIDRLDQYVKKIEVNFNVDLSRVS